MRRKASVFGDRLLLLGVALLSAAALEAAEPVGGKITAIDPRTGMVTAKETATGRTFRFQVNGAELLDSLEAGQDVSADLEAMTVTIRLGADRLKIKDGYSLQRTSPGAGAVRRAKGAGLGIDVECVCHNGTRANETCLIEVQGGMLFCRPQTCTGDCNVKATIPGVKMGPPSLR